MNNHSAENIDFVQELRFQNVRFVHTKLAQNPQFRSGSPFQTIKIDNLFNDKEEVKGIPPKFKKSSSQILSGKFRMA